MLNLKMKVAYRPLYKEFKRSLGQRYRKALTRIGAYVRTVAKNSIRQSKDGSPSKPGSKYPKAHGSALKNFIFFSVEKNNTNVVIGPTYLSRRKSKTKPLTVNAPTRAATRLSILIFGGRQSMRGGDYRPRYTPRPFMQAALEKARSQPRLREAFRDLK